MTQHEPASAPAEMDAPSRRGRRALIAGAATAAVGALGVAVARPADAAAGSAMILGRSNSSGGSTTTVSSTNATVAVNVKSTAGTGLIGETTKNNKWGVHGRNTATALTGGTTGGVRGEGRNNHGVRGDTTNANRHGVVGVNAATAAGSGAAVRANGRLNAGVWADATDINTPAIFADGAGGAGVSIFAFGFADIEGGLFALDAQVGVVSGGLVGGTIVEAGVASGTSPWHIGRGTFTLDLNGEATVTPDAAYTDAADLAQSTVMLTGLGNPIGGAYVENKSASSFTVLGGTAGAQLEYLVIAPRLDVFGVTPAKAGQPARKLTHKTTIHDPR